MKNQLNKLGRRDFLTGAATAVGGGLIASIPGIASAQVKGSSGGSSSSAPALFFWNGSQFIPASSAVPNVNSDSAQVQIEGFGVSPSIATIDVQMPGGTFQAFTAQPIGQKKVQFAAPVKTSLGLTLVVGSSRGTNTLSITDGRGTGPKLALGTYLLADHGVSANGFILTDSAVTPVTFADGQAVSIPYVLVTVSE